MHPREQLTPLRSYAPHISRASLCRRKSAAEEVRREEILHEFWVNIINDLVEIKCSNHAGSDSKESE